MSDADFDGDGAITFAEAHAHAMLTSETIDIPLRSSEALLRTYSEIAGYDHRRGDDAELPLAHTHGDLPADVVLASMEGTPGQIARGAAAELQHTVAGLLKQLELSPDDDIPTVFIRFEELRDTSRDLQREAFRNRRRGSGCRELRGEIAERWPELDGRQWRSAEILHSEDQSELLRQIEQLPNFKRDRSNQSVREETSAAMEQAELRQVKFQRLINTLEAIVLAKNLPKIAGTDVIAHYQRMIALEQSKLASE